MLPGIEIKADVVGLERATIDVDNSSFSGGTLAFRQGRLVLKAEAPGTHELSLWVFDWVRQTGVVYCIKRDLVVLPGITDPLIQYDKVAGELVVEFTIRPEYEGRSAFVKIGSETRVLTSRDVAIRMPRDTQSSTVVAVGLRNPATTILWQKALSVGPALALLKGPSRLGINLDNNLDLPRLVISATGEFTESDISQFLEAAGLKLAGIKRERRNGASRFVVDVDRSVIQEGRNSFSMVVSDGKLDIVIWGIRSRKFSLRKIDGSMRSRFGQDDADPHPLRCAGTALLPHPIHA